MRVFGKGVSPERFLNPLHPDKPNVTLDFADAPISKVGVITCIGYGRPVVQLQLSHEGEEFINGTVHT